MNVASFTERAFLLNGTTLYVLTAAQSLYALVFLTGRTLWVYDAETNLLRLTASVDQIFSVISASAREQDAGIEIDYFRSETALMIGAEFGRREQFVLEARIGDVDHGRDALGVGAAAQVGHAVFRDGDVAQVARDGRVAVTRDDVRRQPAVLAARGAHAPPTCSPP